MKTMFQVDRVIDVARRILEEAAFVFAEAAEEMDDPSSSHAVSVGIDFNGPQSGMIVLAASRPFAIELAANMLGQDPEDPVAVSEADAALAELLNIFAGALAYEVFGSQAVCHLGIPRAIPLASLPPPSLRVPLVTDSAERLEFQLHRADA